MPVEILAKPRERKTFPERLIIPRNIRLESSTICQLNCPACPTASGRSLKSLGWGFLSFQDFKQLVDRNPWIVSIELSNWGEMFLNRDLVKIMRYALKNKIALQATNGVNLNTADRNTLEALVKYKFRKLSCSIDGASQETYSIYRRNGDFNQVIDNVKTINYFKAKYKSMLPQLQWKFIAFGHNEQDIQKGRQMASEMNMNFYVKLAWEDLYTDEIFSPIKDRETVGLETGMGVATREDFRKKYGYDYVLRDCCLEMWRRPQINFDGRVLVCSVNFWGDYGNAFKEGLLGGVNNEKINYARSMLTGKSEPKKGIACSSCKYFAKMRMKNDWITEDEVAQFYVLKNPYIVFTHEIFKNKVTNKTYRALRSVKRKIKPAYSAVKSRLFNNADQKLWNKGHLKSKVYQLEIPMIPDSRKGWRPCSVFNGSTRVMESLTCHASVLIKDFSPHPPHSHDEEELLLVLFGEVDVVMPDLPGLKKTLRLGRGQFVYYPVGFSHTIQTVSLMPSNYLMFKWKNAEMKRQYGLKFGQYNVYGNHEEKEYEGYRAELKLDGPTTYLQKLQCHVSTLGAGAGYEAHRDKYDVAMVVFDGEVETLGRRVGPNGVIFYSAGQLHGIYNPGETVARYVVFEFHK
jgi:MoaA/NifB/PqqE/SkfB family radical SAM enzyme/mannose-6-phosphate isomerase-like protein (cupin superfamily)